MKTDSETFVYKIIHTVSDYEPIFIKSTYNLKEMTRILGCIDFKFEELVTVHATLSNHSVLEILEEFYGIESFSEKEYNFLSNLTLFDEAVHNENWVHIFEFEEEPHQITQFCRYWAREYCCRMDYNEVMINYLPLNNDQFYKKIKTLDIA